MSVLGRADGRDRARARPETVASRRARYRVLALNAAKTPTIAQSSAALAVLVLLAAVVAWRPGPALRGEHVLLLMAFGAVALWRGLTIAIGAPAREPAALEADDLPSYTVIAPLRCEAGMIASLVQALEAIDYPRDRLQVLLALEWDDAATRTAVEQSALPEHFEVEIVRPGSPRTKPRACNAALERAVGEHVVVYDAEDRPDPGQLREAAARFRQGSPELACLQAPLRIPLTGGFVMRQFALEYAALFELTLPTLARLKSAFPLGGTSNHFRTSVLRELGGWDAWNVTEDADLGFRLVASGYACGVLNRPTFEDAPRSFSEWLPQRSRWLKGYMQTWLVYMRRPLGGGLSWFTALQATVGLTVVSALIHAPTLVLISLAVIASTAPGELRVHAPDLMVFGGGWGMAALAMSSAALRAGFKPRLTDALLAPAYWSLQSIAFWRALAQLLTRPHHWDKTPHHPPRAAEANDARLPAPERGAW